MSIKDAVIALLGKSEEDSGEGCANSRQHRFMTSYLEDEDDKALEQHGLTAKRVARYGGTDQGSTYYAVYEFSNTTGESVSVKFDGYYASHYGTDYNGYDFVTPRQKTITEWV